MENDNAGAGGNVSAPPVFKEIEDGPLIELSATDSTEFWLIQWPLHQTADFDGQELSLKLHHDGSLGNLETSSGKSYEVVSYNALAPDATVFLPSGSDSKVVGKISRRVSLVHYPEPSELIEHNLQKKKQQRERHERSIATNSSATPQSQWRSSKSSATGSASMRSGKHRSSMPNPSKSSSKKRHSEKEASKPTQDSGRPQSVVTSSGSMDRHSSERKSNKKHKQQE